jgi:hypothetical protein
MGTIVKNRGLARKDRGVIVHGDDFLFQGRNLRGRGSVSDAVVG